LFGHSCLPQSLEQALPPGDITSVLRISLSAKSFDAVVGEATSKLSQRSLGLVSDIEIGPAEERITGVTRAEELRSDPDFSYLTEDVAAALQHELKVPEVGMATKMQPLRGREVIPDDEKRGGGHVPVTALIVGTR